MDGVELSDVRIGSTQPTLFFVIHVKEPARVNIALQELNSAGRCMLVVSPTHTHPNVDTAVWQLTSPDPMKSVVINPVDENFVVGPLYIGIRYLEDSGSTFIRLRVDLRRSYTAVWFYRSVNPASQTMIRDKVQTILGSTRDKHSTFSNPGAQQNSLYVGEWEGAKHHGRGVCFYAMDAGAMSVLDARRSTLFAAVQQRRPLAWTAGTVIDDSAAPVLSPEKITGITSFDEASRWDMIQPIDENIEVYDGYWKDGMKHGKGVYQWADRVYVGEWQDGKRSGYGELVKADGSWYKGMWENDRKHGTGKTLLLPNGVVYDGNWVSGVKQGPGQLYYPDGTQVTGLWEKNKLQAPVRAVYKDGSSYEGGWDVDARSGEGALTDVEGRVHQHTWKANLREGEGTVRYATGVHYDGSWEDDKSTEGVFVFPNKDRYKGEWNHTTNVREGKGECRYANGDVYTGDWKNDLREGHGVLVTKDGKEYEGSG
ncbi:TIR protein [Angomonas deanei]|uniref:MORN repeat, putative n=1 Tax=Angomonas deanei TaxID=59799 RepID=A0A7G2C3D7_9TRYP|nr:TIR protein [Angomonas deanei]CAD2214308.1 MORN repeat, putative [Angomonas deanei]|eukprot:EPY21168.1 TIR protein [Angomonas deanei]